MHLLTEAASNAKTAKNSIHSQFSTYILHLAPADLSGYNTCPAASAGCKAACLNSAGRGAFSNVQAARIRKTHMLIKERAEFMRQLEADLNLVMKRATKAGLKPVVRLNGTSDLNWLGLKFSDGLHVFEKFPEIMFYDYTKVISRLKQLKLKPIPNYHITFSRSEDNDSQCREALKLGFNVAVVFAGEVPSTYLGMPTVDGDGHDLRFLDAPGSVVALKAKGKAKIDESGFVVSACSKAVSA